MVDGRDDPGQPEAEEDVDGVAAGDVPDGVVGMFLVDRGSLAGEGVRQGGSQSHEGDGCHLVLQPDQAAEDPGKVPHDDHNDADEDERNDEAGPPSKESGWRDQSEDEFEAERQQVHDIVYSAGLLNISSVDYHGIFQLLGPCIVVNSEFIHISVGPHHNLVHDAVEVIVVGDGNSSFLDLAKLPTVVHLVQFYLKVFILLRIHVVHNGNVNAPLGLAVLELDDTLPAGEVLATDRRLVRCLPLDGDVTIRPVLPESYG